MSTNADAVQEQPIEEQPIKIKKTPAETLALAYKTVYTYRDELIKKQDCTPNEQQIIDAVNFLFPDGTEGKAEDFMRWNRLINTIIEEGEIGVIELYRDFDKLEIRHLEPVVTYAKKYKDIEISVNELTGEIKHIPSN